MECWVDQYSEQDLERMYQEYLAHKEYIKEAEICLKTSDS